MIVGLSGGYVWYRDNLIGVWCPLCFTSDAPVVGICQLPDVVPQSWKRALGQTTLCLYHLNQSVISNRNWERQTQIISVSCTYVSVWKFHKSEWELTSIKHKSRGKKTHVYGKGSRFESFSTIIQIGIMRLLPARQILKLSFIWEENSTGGSTWKNKSSDFIQVMGKRIPSK